jgi:hypothetical protein
MLTASLNDRASASTVVRQRASCEHAVSRTYAPSGMMMPDSSALPMNSAGASRPPVGWFQRTSASAPTMLPLCTSTTGWYQTTNSPRSNASERVLAVFKAWCWRPDSASATANTAASTWPTTTKNTPRANHELSSWAAVSETVDGRNGPASTPATTEATNAPGQRKRAAANMIGKKNQYFGPTVAAPNPTHATQQSANAAMTMPAPTAVEEFIK